MAFSESELINLHTVAKNLADGCDPGFYSGTFCCGCRAHFPLDQFVWDGTQEVLGT